MAHGTLLQAASRIAWRCRLLAPAVLAFAADLAAVAEEPEAMPRVAVQLVDGKSVAGRIAAVEDQALSLESEGRSVSYALADVVAMEFERHGEAVGPTADRWLLLAGGDRAPLTPIDIVDDALLCRWEAARQRPDWRVPIQFVAAALFQPLDIGGASSRVPELSFRQFREDTLILRDGTRLTGVLEDVGADAIQIETAVGAVPVETARVDAFALDAALIRAPTIPESSALVVTRDGAWLTLHDWSIDASGELAGTTGIGVDLRAPLPDVVRIACYGPRVVDLTHRKPIEIQVTPFVSRAAELLVNRNVRGGFLRLDGREYPRGFGMTSGMSATFALAPGDRQFRATIGLDDSIGDDGSVVFAVDLDGRRVFTSPVLTGRTAPIAIGPLDVTGGERLTLAVEFADRGNVQDVANWCDVVVLR